MLPRGLNLDTFGSRKCIFRPHTGPFLTKIVYFDLQGVIFGPIWDPFWTQADNFGPKKAPKVPFCTPKVAQKDPKRTKKEPLGTVLGPFWLESSPKGQFRTQKLQFDVKIIFKRVPLGSLLGPFWVPKVTLWDHLGPSRGAGLLKSCSNSSSGLGAPLGLLGPKNLVKMQSKQSKAQNLCIFYGRGKVPSIVSTLKCSQNRLHKSDLIIQSTKVTYFT